MGAFTSLNIDFLNILVMTVALVLTAGNGWVTAVVSGGHRLRMAYSFSFTCLITGLLMTILPGMANKVFETVTATP
jgi:archaellum biogenesis protein FlaJ (TadC family)